MVIIGILVMIYIANVLSCVIICEAQHEGALVRQKAFMIPFLNVGMFLFYLFSKQDERSGLQYALKYLKTPAKNYLIVNVLAQLAQTNKKKTVTKNKRSVRFTFPEITAFTSLFEKQVAYAQSRH